MRVPNISILHEIARGVAKSDELLDNERLFIKNAETMTSFTPRQQAWLISLAPKSPVSVPVPCKACDGEGFPPFVSELEGERCGGCSGEGWVDSTPKTQTQMQDRRIASLERQIEALKSALRESKACKVCSCEDESINDLLESEEHDSRLAGLDRMIRQIVGPASAIPKRTDVPVWDF